MSQVTLEAVQAKQTELEEAEGYEALMAHASISADAVAANIANDTPRMGAKVRISAQHLHPKQQKYAGKEGTITGKIGDAWDVTFRGRSGGISSFMADQISVVVA